MLAQKQTNSGSSPSSSSRGTESGGSTPSSSESLANIEKSGFLKKKGLFGKWKESWFAIQHGIMYEYKYKSEKMKPHKEFNLGECQLRRANELSSEEDTFALIVNSRVTLFKASSASELESWMSAIEQVKRVLEGKPVVENASVSNLADSFSDAVILADAQANIIGINEPTLKLFGYFKEDVPSLIGKPVTIFTPPHITERHASYVARYHETKEKMLIGKPRNFNAIRKDGSTIPILFFLSEIKDQKGNTIFMANIRDNQLGEIDFSTNKLKQDLNDTVDKLCAGLKAQLQEAAEAMVSNYTNVQRKVKTLKAEKRSYADQLTALGKQIEQEKKTKDIALLAVLNLIVPNDATPDKSDTEYIKSIISQEMETNQNVNSLFRDDSLNTKRINSFILVRGAEYLHQVLETPITEFIKSNKLVELNPAVDKEATKGVMDKRQQTVEKFCSSLLNAIVQSVEQCPPEFCEVFAHIKAEVATRFLPNAVDYHQLIGGFLCLRFFVPAIIAPVKYRVVDSVAKAHSQKGLVYAARIIQRLSNASLFASGEEYLKPFNKFITDNKNVLNEYIDNLIKRGEQH